jgi:transcriptional regulator with XRE-family HTH domain
MELRQKSLADLAAATGLSEAGITAIANAEWTSKTPLLTDIWLLARALDVDTPSMLGHTPLQAQAVERATEAVAELQARLDWCRSYGVDDARIAQITQAVRR